MQRPVILIMGFLLSVGMGFLFSWLMPETDLETGRERSFLMLCRQIDPQNGLGLRWRMRETEISLHTREILGRVQAGLEQRMRLCEQNIRESRTYLDAQGKNHPYLRKEGHWQSDGRLVVTEDTTTERYMRYQPQSPVCNEYGYIVFPNVNIYLELVEAIVTSRQMEALERWRARTFVGERNRVICDHEQKIRELTAIKEQKQRENEEELQRMIGPGRPLMDRIKLAVGLETDESLLIRDLRKVRLQMMPPKHP